MGQNRRLGLALGGGGARGLAHIGVLQVLAESSIEVHAICGSSVGAIIGAGYALYRDPYLLEDVFYSFLESEIYKAVKFDQIKAAVIGPESDGLAERLGWLIKRNYLRGKLLAKAGLLSGELFSQVIDFLVPDMEYRDTKIPFCCVALDLSAGGPVVFREGSLRETILASSAAAGLVSPVEYQGRILADGNWIYSVPVEPLKEMYVETILAVDVDQNITPQEEFGSIVDIILRAHDVAIAVIKDYQLEQAELVLRPNVGHYHWSDFRSAGELIETGRETARKHLADIKNMIRRRWWTAAALQGGLGKRRWLRR